MLQSCIKEDLEECIYSLTFNFEPPDRNPDDPPFTVDIGSLSVFAFNSEGLFAKEFKAEKPGKDSRILITLPDGNYTLVVWGGFTDAQHADAGLVEGSTRIEDFYMHAFIDNANGNSVPAQPLYYGIVNSAAVDIPPVILSEQVQMVQSTKPFRVEISGLDESKYELVISNNAGRYNYENILVAPGQGGSKSTVEPMTKVVSLAKGAVISAAAAYRARTGILWPEGLGDRQITIMDLGTGHSILTLSLAELLAKLPNVDFDKEPAVNMMINYRSEVEIDVNLNGWWIIYSDNEI